LSSGYGSLEQYFSVDHLPVNLAAYPAWLLQTTPLLGIVGALVFIIRPAMPVEDGHRRDLVVACGAVAAMNFACYAFYLTFEGWWALRFLAPSLPPLLVLACVGLAGAGRRLPGRMRPLTALLLAAAIVYSVNYVRVHSWGGQYGEYRYARAGEYIAEHVPEPAVLFAMLHSGTARYYTSRPTVRWDLMEAGALDDAIDRISELGYHPYLLLDAWEEDDFRARFAGASRLGRLDWDPVVSTPDGVRIYDALPRIGG
jgi:hypothetical protein